MATRNLVGRVSNLNFTATEWTSSNPILLAGEIGIESDTKKIKIGDGTSNWSDLDYFVGDVDLSNYATKDEIPSELPNPETLAIQVNGSELGTYDGSTETTVNITMTADAIPMSSAEGAATISATLDTKADLVDGVVPASQLPSYVDDVLEYESYASLPETGESGKIYVTTDTNLTYRWSGSQYVEISASLALGETESTAYRGDRGAVAYEHSQITSGNPHGTTGADIAVSASDTTTVETALSNASTALTTHTENSDIHVTTENKEAWNAKLDAVASATEDNIATLASDGTLKDSGTSINDVLTSSDQFIITCSLDVTQE